jgi:hypothetical protein
MDIEQLAGLLRETSDRHEPFEKSHAPHNWWDWYAVYIHSRAQGSTPEQASQVAGRYMEQVLHVKPL